MLPEFPSPHDPHVRHLRHLFLAVVTGSFLFLIPWIGYLSVTLPDHHEVSQWRFAWVGFDGALIAALGITALCAWRRLQIFIPWAVITATLLCCDAWFDIVLDWNGGLSPAMLSAACAELPLAALLVYVARKMIRLTVIIAWHRAGRPGPVPTLSRMTLIKLTAAESEQDRPCPLPAEGPRRGAGHPRTARPGPHARPGGAQPYKHDRDHRQGDPARGGHRDHDSGPDHHHDGEPR